jgi:mannosyltransferase
MHRPTAMRVIGYALAAALSLYAHLFAAFALFGQALALACGAVRLHLPGMPRSAARNRMPGRWWALIGLGGASLAALPLYLISRHQTGEIGWIPHLSLATVASFLSRLGGAAMMAPLVVLAAGALVRWPRRAQPQSTGVAGTEQPLPEPAPAGGIDGDPRLARWMLVGWVLLPPLALIALDPVQAVLLPRYALVAVPALVMVAAAGARQIGGWWGRGVVVIALLAGAATSAVQQAQPYKYEDFRAAADAVADSARPGDGLVFLPSSLRVGFLAYAGADRDNPHPPSLADVALWPGQGPAVSAQIGGVEVSPGAMAGDLSYYPRVYAIDGSSPSTALPDLAKQAVLSHQYRASWVRWFGGISVTLYLRQTS